MSQEAFRYGSPQQPGYGSHPPPPQPIYSTQPVGVVAYPPVHWEKRPEDYLVASVLMFFLCNSLCLGGVALAFSLLSYNAATHGNYEEAKKMGERAKIANIASFVSSVIIIVAVVIYVVVLLSS